MGRFIHSIQLSRLNGQPHVAGGLGSPDAPILGVPSC
jgi:hypothetical protein